MIVSLRDAHRETSGAKASVLGVLLNAGLPVPDGFVVCFDSYREATARWNLSLAGTDAEASDVVSHALRTRPLPDELLDALARQLASLGDARVAVRSSANTEDGIHASGAGQHDTVLGVQGVSDVADAIRHCWASAHSVRAAVYRTLTQDDDRSRSSPLVAVLVQRLVDADVAGVMFTATDASDGDALIEGSWGLGSSVVGGTVTPDTYRVAADGSVACSISDKRTRIDRLDGGLVSRQVSSPARTARTLDDAAASRLADMGHRVAELLGGPQDIEWAIVGGRTWILQSRPITAEALRAPADLGPVPPSTLRGAPGSRGSATGTARVITGPDDFHRVREGDILVCPHTDPAWTPLLRIVAGVVTDIGGVLSHAAIVARELHIPAVLGNPRSTTEIPDGAIITIDGDTGTIELPPVHR